MDFGLERAVSDEIIELLIERGFAALSLRLRRRPPRDDLVRLLVGGLGAELLDEPESYDVERRHHDVENQRRNYRHQSRVRRELVQFHCPFNLNKIYYITKS